MTQEEKRRRILEECRKIQFGDIAKLLFSYDAPENQWIHAIPRLNLLLDGEIALNCFDNGEFHTECLSAPAIYYCTATGYQICKTQKPDNLSKVLSFCYYPNYIRLVLVGYKDRRESVGQNLYYHSSLPLSSGGFQLIKGIDLLYREGEKQLVRRLLDELFSLTLLQLEASGACPASRPPLVWDNINTYLRSHREVNSSRTQVSKMFNVSPGYVSRLARRYTGSDFVTLTTNYRLEHAAMLLRESHLSVKEISARCGFCYLSYFCRRFKQRYGTTPSSYRDYNHMTTTEEAGNATKNSARNAHPLSDRSDKSDENR